MATIGEKESTYIAEVLGYEFRTSKNGHWVSKLEDKVKEFYNKKYAIAMCNGTATLHTALLAAGVGEGDFVITTPLTMSSPSIAIRLCGATPIYVDVDPITWNIDFHQMKRRILHKAKAIIGVSLYGMPCDFTWFNKHLRPGCPDIVTINDSAEQVKPYDCGADIVSLSYQASKQLSCGEGGMIVTDRADLAKRIRQYANLGYPIDDSMIKKVNIQQFHAVRHTVLGYNYRMSDLQAAVMLGQYEKNTYTKNMDMRLKAAKTYRDGFKDIGAFTTQCLQLSHLIDKHSYWTYAVDCGSYAEQILKYNKEDSLGAYPVWELAYKEPALLQDTYCPVAERLSNSVLQFPTNIPSHQADYVTKMIRIRMRKKDES